MWTHFTRRRLDPLETITVTDMKKTLLIALLMPSSMAMADFQQSLGNGMYLNLDNGGITLPMGGGNYLTPDNHIERRINGRNSAVIDMTNGDISLPYGKRGGVVKKNGDIVIPIGDDYLQDDPQ